MRMLKLFEQLAIFLYRSPDPLHHQIEPLT